MSQSSTAERLAILADAAKCDALCASSGTSKRSSSTLRVRFTPDEVAERLAELVG